MITVTKPCLATVSVLGYTKYGDDGAITGEEKGLAESLPKNCYIQSITIECCRTSKYDETIPWAGSKHFSLRRAARGMYISKTQIPLTTPVEKKQTELDFSWDSVVSYLKEADEISAKEGDQSPIRERVVVKDCAIVEIPLENWHDAPFYPQGDDWFYDGKRFSLVEISAANFLSDVEMVRNGWLPGATHKPMDVVRFSYRKTKHVGRGMVYASKWKAYSRKDEDIITIDEKELTNRTDEEYAQMFPSLCKAGIIQIREQVVHPYDVRRDRVEEVTLRKLNQ